MRKRFPNAESYDIVSYAVKTVESISLMVWT